jgi:type VI secretion system protein ImpA
MNIDALLSPISEAAPSGEDLSFSNEFDEIAELRREDDPTLDQGEWVTSLKTADWPGVEKRCAELLEKRSKDLRLAMWLAEASALNRGYPGLQQGLELCARLSESFWDTLYPEADDGDMEQRIGNIGWFLKRAVALAEMAPVTQGRAGAFSLRQMQSARSLQATLDKSPEKAAQLDADVVTLDKFNRALKETPKPALAANIDTVQACLAALAQWQAVIDAKLGADGPSFVPAREALAAALHEVQRLAKDMGAIQQPVAEAGGADSGEGDAAAAGGGDTVPRGAGGPPRTRDQALQQLREVATYFRNTEPHSPVAYLAEKAVKWGEMPLHVWLRAVVKDSNALAQLEDLLGAEPGEGNA